jgi:hypothetical protein
MPDGRAVSGDLSALRNHLNVLPGKGGNRLGEMISELDADT